MKRTLLLALALVCALSLTACNKKEAPTTPGSSDGETRTGKANGYGGVVTAKVILDKDGKITDVSVDAPDETETVAGAAIASLPDAIKAAGTTAGIDTVSGATVTSTAIIGAVNNALDPEAYPYENTAETERKTVAMEEGSLKTGFGYVVSVAGAKSAEYVNTDAAVAGVTVTADGKVHAARVDTYLAEMAISGEGKSLVGADAAYQTATESGTAYTDFEASLVGLSADQVRALKNGTNDALVDAVAMAIDSALSLGAKEGDKLGLGVVVNPNNRDATAERAGQTQAYGSYAVATFGEGNTVTSCIFDATQSTVAFDTSGVISTDTEEPVRSKLDLRDAYGMRGASSIGKEAHEQLWALADFATGRTYEDLTGLSVDDTGHANDPQIKSGVTVKIGDYNSALKKAQDSAK